MADRNFDIEIKAGGLKPVPSAIKEAGTAGEHLATSLTFNLPAEYIGGFTYSLDAISGAGTAYVQPLHIIGNDTFLYYEIPYYITKMGALSLILNITEIATDAIAKSPPIYIQFKGYSVTSYEDIPTDYIPETSATDDALNAASLANLKAGLVQDLIDEAEATITQVEEAIAIVEPDLATFENVIQAIADTEDATAAAIAAAGGTVPNGSITPRKTNYLTLSINLFDYTSVPSENLGKFLSTVGTLSSSATYVTSDYIAVLPNTAYFLSAKCRSAFYDANKAFIAGSYTAASTPYTDGYTVTSPATGAFIRVSPYQTTAPNYTLFQLEPGTTKHTFEAYTKWTVPAANIDPAFVPAVVPAANIDPLYISPLADLSVTPKKTNFAEYTTNLFNLNTAVVDTILSGDHISTLSGYYTSDYIPIENGVEYTLYPVRAYAKYNSAKTLLANATNTGSNTGTVTFTATADGYLKISCYSTYLATCQVEIGATSTPFCSYGVTIPYLSNTAAQNSAIVALAASLQSYNVTVIKVGTLYTMLGRFNDTLQIQIAFDTAASGNGSFSWVNARIYQSHTLQSPTDDISPFRLAKYGDVGANHGYATIAKVTLAGHDKLTADLGSTWTDGTTVYTLLKISGNDLYLATSTAGATAYVAPTGTLTHVSGATHTTSITITTIAAAQQLYPSVNHISNHVFMDGKEITADGTYYGAELIIRENYTIMSYFDLLTWAQANIGTSYANDSIEGLCKISNTFVYGAGLNCTVHTSILALKSFTTLDYWSVQSTGLAPPIGYTRKRFMPNVKPKSGFDFAAGVDMTDYATSLVFANTDCNVETLYPNHIVEWLYNSSSERVYGWAMGYVTDKSNSKNADRVTAGNNCFDMRSTKKAYPIVMGAGNFVAGDYRNFIGFRNFLNPLDMPNVTAIVKVKDKSACYLYIDTNADTNDSTPVDTELGKSVTVIQNENFTAKNDVVDANGVAFSTTGTIGNAVLKLS